MSPDRTNLPRISPNFSSATRWPKASRPQLGGAFANRGELRTSAIAACKATARRRARLEQTRRSTLHAIEKGKILNAGGRRRTGPSGRRRSEERRVGEEGRGGRWA